MLVLSRKLDESIVINGNIRVKLVAMLDNRVKLGIEAPEGVTVDREEVHFAILRQGHRERNEGGES